MNPWKQNRWKRLSRTADRLGEIGSIEALKVAYFAGWYWLVIHFTSRFFGLEWMAAIILAILYRHHRSTQKDIEAFRSWVGGYALPYVTRRIHFYWKAKTPDDLKWFAKKLEKIDREEFEDWLMSSRGLDAWVDHRRAEADKADWLAGEQEEADLKLKKKDPEAYARLLQERKDDEAAGHGDDDDDDFPI